MEKGTETSWKESLPRMAGKGLQDWSSVSHSLLRVQGLLYLGLQKRAKESIHTNTTEKLKEFAHEQNQYDDSISWYIYQNWYQPASSQAMDVVAVLEKQLNQKFLIPVSVTP